MIKLESHTEPFPQSRGVVIESVAYVRGDSESHVVRSGAVNGSQPVESCREKTLRPSQRTLRTRRLRGELIFGPNSNPLVYPLVRCVKCPPSYKCKI